MSSTSKILTSLQRVAASTNLRSSSLPTTTLKSATALLSTTGSTEHTLPDLPYDYNALEPVISTETMTLHHSKHHQTYVTNLNAGLEKYDAALTKAKNGDSSGVTEMVSLEAMIRFNGGGHVNHALFWENLCAKDDSELKDGVLKGMIDEKFGSLDGLKAELGAMSIGVQGSGWGWLGYNPKTATIECMTRANQDPLQATTGLIPLLGIDVWEHAYYVDYRNVRPNYVNAIWDVINWDVVEQRLLDAQGK